jgi:hypothetical protein
MSTLSVCGSRRFVARHSEPIIHITHPSGSLTTRDGTLTKHKEYSPPAPSYGVVRTGNKMKLFSSVTPLEQSPSLTSIISHGSSSLESLQITECNSAKISATSAASVGDTEELDLQTDRKLLETI